MYNDDDELAELLQTDVNIAVSLREAGLDYERHPEYLEFFPFDIDEGGSAPQSILNVIEDLNNTNLKGKYTISLDGQEVDLDIFDFEAQESSGNTYIVDIKNVVSDDYDYDDEEDEDEYDDDDDENYYGEDENY